MHKYTCTHTDRPALCVGNDSPPPPGVEPSLSSPPPPSSVRAPSLHSLQLHYGSISIIQISCNHSQRHRVGMAARHSSKSRTLNTLISYWACCVSKKRAGEEINKLSRPSFVCHARCQDKGWKQGWEAGFIMSSAKTPFSPQPWHVRSSASAAPAAVFA